MRAPSHMRRQSRAASEGRQADRNCPPQERRRNAAVTASAVKTLPVTRSVESVPTKKTAAGNRPSRRRTRSDAGHDHGMSRARRGGVSPEGHGRNGGAEIAQLEEGLPEKGHGADRSRRRSQPAEPFESRRAACQRHGPARGPRDDAALASARRRVLRLTGLRGGPVSSKARRPLRTTTRYPPPRRSPPGDVCWTSLGSAA